MKTLWLALKKLIINVVASLFCVIILGIVLAMFFGPPIAIVAETVDMMRIRQTAPGRVDGITIERDTTTELDSQQPDESSIPRSDA